MVDPFNELGKLRSKNELDREYQRLLARDRNPFAFLYNGAEPVNALFYLFIYVLPGFRREWGTFESIYLFAKLAALLLIAIVNPDNCLFRTLSRTHITVVCQALLLVTMCAFLLVQCFIAPFLDPVNNASEFTSRINYVATSALSLGVALDVPAQALLTGPLLYGYVSRFLVFFHAKTNFTAFISSLMVLAFVGSYFTRSNDLLNIPFRFYDYRQKFHA